MSARLNGGGAPGSNLCVLGSSSIGGDDEESTVRGVLTFNAQFREFRRRLRDEEEGDCLNLKEVGLLVERKLDLGVA